VSPLARESFREYQDREFLQAIGQDHLSSKLADFRPIGGPQWDALAVLEHPRVGVILVEAKAYPEEAENRHCRAEGASRTKISERLDEVKATLGADMTADWLGSRYQVANRLAHLYFLRSHGVPAWYVQICFCDDATHRPTTAARWREALPDLWRDLGLSTVPEFVADLLLPGPDCAI
jgi:glutathione S-transferase